MMGNPAKPEEPKKAYGVAQYTEKMSLEQFSEHISDHNSVYDAEDVQAILGKAVKCLREMLLAGKKVELGKLGEFYVTLQGKGTDTAKEYNPAACVEKVNVVWTPGKQFEDLKKDAVFNLVLGRKAAAEAIKDAKTKADHDASSGSTTDSDKDSGASGKGDGGSQGSGSTTGDGNTSVQ